MVRFVEAAGRADTSPRRRHPTRDSPAAPVWGRVLALAAGAWTVLASGCGAAPPPIETPSPPPATLTRPGLCLDDLGYEKGPGDRLCLPPDSVLTYTYEADRTLIALGPVSAGKTVLDYLAATLPDLGWTVTGASADALRFDDGTWQGSFVIGGQTWGLTVRSE